MPLLALALSPAKATVTFLKAGAYSQTRVGIGAPDTVTDGPSDQSSDFDADPYVVSRSDSVDERFQAQVRASSAGAGSFERPASAEFFVRSSVDAEALAGQLATHGTAIAGTFYNFSVDTESMLAFTIDTVPVSANPTANIMVDLFSLDALGHPSTYYRLGYFAGRGTSSYTLPAGSYGFELAAFSEGTVPANLISSGGAISGASANLSLSIVSPTAPVAGVPEPATWAMMLAGFGFIGGVMRLCSRANASARDSARKSSGGDRSSLPASMREVIARTPRPQCERTIVGRSSPDLPQAAGIK